MPFFSVIIPSYNRAAFLKSAVISVLEQDFSDFEILIVDDGSTDNTRDLIAEMSRTDARIKYIFQQNSERGAARNRGIKQSEGHYLVFLDSDDIMLSAHLSTLKSAIEKNPDIHLLATKFEFQENGKCFTAPIQRFKGGLYDYTLLIRGNPFACNVCIKKDNPSLILFREERNYSAMEDWIFLFSNTWSKDVLLIDKITIRMNEHDQRSMRFYRLISERRKTASDYILQHFSLNKNEIRKIKGYTAYFNAIHSYLDRERRQGITHLLKAMKYLGLRKELFTLYIKLILGRKNIGRIKTISNTEHE